MLCTVRSGRPRLAGRAPSAKTTVARRAGPVDAGSPATEDDETVTAATRRTSCTRDCPDACGILATIEGDRVVALRGDPDHPVTRGFLCFRTSRFVDLQEAPHRLRQPLVRRGGELVPVTMDEALDHVAERLLAIRAESGPAAIFHYRSGGSLGLLKGVADRFFEHFGPCTTKIGDICSGAGEAAQVLDLGVSDSNDLFDLLHSRTIVLWGKNPFVSNVHLVPVIKDARARGARVVLIDPVRHKGTALADDYLQIAPGGDLDLALGVVRALADRGGLDPEAASRCNNLDGFLALVRGRTAAEHAAAAGVETADVERLAAAFAGGPAAILVGWGMQRRRHGAAIVRSLDALSAVSGNLFVRGGGCSFYFRRRSAFATRAVSSDAAARHIREPLFGADVLAARDPRVRAIWITAGNPVCMLPDSARVAEALAAAELVVVVDPFLTDTGRRAHVVLPCPTLLEDDDLVGAYGHHWVGDVRPVVPPPPGVWHELAIFQALARRTGLSAAMAGTIDDYKRRLLAPAAERGLSLEALRAAGAARNPAAREILFEGGRVQTPSGKVELMTEAPQRPAPPRGFPLWLFSNSTERSQASQWSGKGLGEHTFVRVHPAAAGGRAEGELVTVESEHGAVRARLELDPGQREDVAIMPKGGHFDRGQSANALIEARATDLGLGAAYLDCWVRLR
jgi:anaerobic selenocysteine-containing dehydrogenase